MAMLAQTYYEQAEYEPMLSSMPTIASNSIEQHAESLQAKYAREKLEVWCRSEEVQDSFDSQGASDELLEYWTRQENNAWRYGQRASTENAEATELLQSRDGLLSPANFMDGRTLSQPLRYLAIQILRMFVHDPNSLGEATILFDNYVFLTNETDVDMVYMLPATCAAIAALLQKTEDALADFNVDVSLVCQQALLAGYPVVARVTSEMIANQERRILETLEWRIALPTIDKWTAMFTVRFNTLTRCGLVDDLRELWQLPYAMGMHIAMCEAFSKYSSPKSLAVGLKCIQLVLAGLIPLQALRPPKLSSREWELLFDAGRLPWPKVKHDKPAGVTNLLPDFLPWTFGISFEEVQEHCLTTCMTVQRLAANAITMQGVPSSENKAPSPLHFASC
mmetsp:Transcript_81041/g.127647  ORF Transcript_81041/g.127647 Transcript_81041/m.127647 type:complete len:393 (-) Transcript_81041:223-1401(-)